MNYIKDIVDVDISITNPVASTDAFTKLVIVGPAAENAADAAEEMNGLVEVKEVADLTEYGYTSDDPAFAAASVAFAQNPCPKSIFVAAQESGEKIADCLTRINNGLWFGFTLAGISDANYADAATWAEANKKLFGFSYSADQCPVSLEGLDYTFGIYSGKTGDTTVKDGNKYEATALMAKCFCYEPGSETWEHKNLNNVSTSKGLTTEAIRNFEKLPVMWYYTVANRNITRNAKVGSGEWIDVIRMKDYIISEIENGVVDLLASNVKVPYTDAGITAVKNVVAGVLKKEQDNGGIENDVYNDDGTITYGYTVEVPKAADISKVDKKERKLHSVTFTARIVGAIHFVQIRGTLVYGGAE